MQWRTKPKNSESDETLQSLADNATLTLVFDGDQVVGEIQASGFYSQVYGQPHEQIYNQPSTYKAKITGTRQKSELADSLREILSTSSFTGRWNTTIGDWEHVILLGRIIH